MTDPVTPTELIAEFRGLMASREAVHGPNCYDSIKHRERERLEAHIIYRLPDLLDALEDAVRNGSAYTERQALREKLAKSQEETASIVNATLKELDQTRAKVEALTKERDQWIAAAQGLNGANAATLAEIAALKTVLGQALDFIDNGDAPSVGNIVQGDLVSRSYVNLCGVLEDGRALVDGKATGGA